MLKKTFVMAMMLTLTVLSLQATADNNWKRAQFTFSQPVALPGVTLPAGSYDFERHDLDLGRHFVRIREAGTGKVMATLPTVAAYKLNAAEKPVLMLSERGRGLAPAVKTWFYPGDPIGMELVHRTSVDGPAAMVAAD
jgi:hypothetical protein